MILLPLGTGSRMDEVIFEEFKGTITWKRPNLFREYTGHIQWSNTRHEELLVTGAVTENMVLRKVLNEL